MKPNFVRSMVLVALAGCGGSDSTPPPPPPPPVPASVTLGISSPDVMTSFGDTRTVTAVVKDADANIITSPTVTWSSSAPTVVNVTSSGLTTTATAMADGNATITATSGTATASVATSVAQRLSSVLLDPASVGLTVSGTRQLTATARDARANLIAGVTGYEFSSNNTSVATVSTTGLVTAAAVGNATITASVTRNTVTASGTSSVIVSSSGGSSTATVTTTNSSFVPSSVTIIAGGTVTWQFGTTAHNVNFAAGTPVAGIPSSSNTSIARTFPTVGSFSYFCSLHENMTGTVVVN